MDENTRRLVDAARAVWDARDYRDTAEMPLQELYNAMRSVTGEPCDHDWFPKAAVIGGRMFTHCDKCGLERSPDDPGIKIREQ